jgi:hypothetical protein
MTEDTADRENAFTSVFMVIARFLMLAYTIECLMLNKGGKVREPSTFLRSTWPFFPYQMSRIQIILRE